MTEPFRQRVAHVTPHVAIMNAEQHLDVAVEAVSAGDEDLALVAGAVVRYWLASIAPLLDSIALQAVDRRRLATVRMRAAELLPRVPNVIRGFARAERILKRFGRRRPEPPSAKGRR